jgi:hypothetical protein
LVNVMSDETACPCLLAEYLPPYFDLTLRACDDKTTTFPTHKSSPNLLGILNYSDLVVPIQLNLQFNN